LVEGLTEFVTDDGAIILVHYTGLVEQTDRFKQAAEADRSTEWTDQYMRLTLRFETGACKELAALNMPCIACVELCDRGTP
jgi:hypothetical protein